MSLRWVSQCVHCCPTLALLDSPELPLGDSLHVRLRNALRAEFADGSPVAAVEAAASLLSLVQFGRFHGLERPEVRTRLGKPPTGLIQLRAYYSGDQVVIELADDGQGLDDEKIVHKALAQGLISSPEGLSESDIWQLIFAPGFSTADQVTDISGRGVGMDVVRKSIEGLHGCLEVRSRRGWGTVFVLSLPTARRTPVARR